MEQRVIKFKIWDKEDKIMSGGYDITDAIFTYKENRGSKNGTAILLQFTGLTDKNRVEIYEGDIITAVGYKPMVVTWNNRFSSFCIKNETWMFQHWFGEAIEGDECEVIGNIYSNPELLKEKE